MLDLPMVGSNDATASRPRLSISLGTLTYFDIRDTFVRLPEVGYRNADARSVVYKIK